MRYLVAAVVISLAAISTGCSVKVDNKPAPEPIIKRKADIHVDAPGVDVNIDRNK